jgi:hypothetical protein
MELDVDGHAEHSSCITAVPMEWLQINGVSPLNNNWSNPLFSKREALGP